MVGGELVGGGVEQGVRLIAGHDVVGDGRQRRHAGGAQGQGAGAAERALLRRSGLDQGAQVMARLIQHSRVARGQARLQHQGGAVQPQFVLDRTLLPLERVHGAVQQSGGRLQRPRLACDRCLPGPQPGVQGGHRRGGVAAPGGRQGREQGQDGVQPGRFAAQVEGQHPALGQFQRGADGLIVVASVAGGVASGGLGPFQTGGCAAAAGVLAPQGRGAQGRLMRARTGDAAGVHRLLTRLDLDQAQADQLQPSEVVAVARLLEQPPQISAEFEHHWPSSSRFGIARAILSSLKQTQRRRMGSA
ncbi:hypothetical protein D3C85_578270 [compost metagenome]